MQEAGPDLCRRDLLHGEANEPMTLAMGDALDSLRRLVSGGFLEMEKISMFSRISNLCLGSIV